MNSFSSNPDLCLLDANKHPHLHPNCENQKLSSDITKCPVGGKTAPLKNQ